MANINKKSYDLVNRISKNFTIYISNFAVVSTLLFKIKLKVAFRFAATLIASAKSDVSLKRVKFLISTIKLVQGISTNVKAGIPRILYTLKQSFGIATTIPLYSTKLVLLAKLKQKVSSNIFSGKAKATFAPVYGAFWALSHFDASLLSAVDSSTLADMDYSVL